MMNSKLLTCVFGVVLTLLLGEGCCSLVEEGNPEGDSNSRTANVECDEGFIFNPDTFRCYKFFDQRKLWHEARDICIENNGVLAKIDTEEIKDWVEDVVFAGQGKPNYWVGLKDEEDDIDSPEDGIFLWRDGSQYPLSGSLWFDDGDTRAPDGNLPDNNCVAMRHVNNANAYFLDDFPCNFQRRFVCCSAKICPNIDDLDLRVIQDVSGSIAIPGGLATARTFLKTLLDHYEPGSRSISRSLYTFSSDWTEVWNEASTEDLETAIANLPIQGVSTDTAGMLLSLPSIMGTNCTVNVIVTDGMSDDPQFTMYLAMGLQNFGQRFCVVPVGCPSCDAEAELSNLVGSNGQLVDSNKLLDPVAAADAAAQCVCDLCGPL